MSKFLLFILALMAMTKSALAQTPMADPRNSDPWPAIMESPVDKALRGIWSKPDCGHADKMFIMSDYFIMKAWPEIYYIGPVRGLRSDLYDGDTLYHLQSLRYSVVFHLSNDGLLKTREVPVHPQQVLNTTWGTQFGAVAEEYTRCSRLFETSLKLTQEEVNTPFILDSIHKGCVATTRDNFASDQTCQKTIFDVLDSSQDGFLNRDELARLYRQGVFTLSATAQICQQKAVYTEDTKTEANEFAVQFYDRVKPVDERGITMAELTRTLADPAIMEGRTYQLIETLRNLNSVLDFVPAPDSARTCAAPTNLDPSTSGTVLPDTDVKKAE